MDFKEISELRNNYADATNNLREGIVKWFNEIIDKGEFFDLEDAGESRLVAYEDGENPPKAVNCTGFGRDEFNGELYFNLDCDPKYPVCDMDVYDVFCIAGSVNYILEENEKNFPHIKVGGLVHWNDPGINDYDEEDREDVLNTVWEIVEIKGSVLIEDDTIILIKNEYGSEAEVYANELRPAALPPLSLNFEQKDAWKMLKKAWKKCKDSGVDFIAFDHLLRPVNGRLVKEYLDNDYVDDGTPSVSLDELDFKDSLAIDVRSLFIDSFELSAILK